MVSIKVSSVEIVYYFDSLVGFLMRISRNTSKIKHIRMKAGYGIAMAFSMMNKPLSNVRQMYKSPTQIKRTKITSPDLR